MSGTPLHSTREIVEILGTFGFMPVMETGTHYHLLHPCTQRIVTVPSHPQIAAGTLRAILGQAGIDPDAFAQQYRRLAGPPS